jgi:hypothetical protein
MAQFAKFFLEATDEAGTPRWVAIAFVILFISVVPSIWSFSRGLSYSQLGY